MTLIAGRAVLCLRFLVEAAMWLIRVERDEEKRLEVWFIRLSSSRDVPQTERGKMRF
jgi:hypothetical protein